VVSLFNKCVFIDTPTRTHARTHAHTHTHTHTHTKLTLTREHIVYVTQKHRTDICLVIKELNSGETVHKITHINVKTVTINEIMIKIVYSICHAGLVSQSQ